MSSEEMVQVWLKKNEPKRADIQERLKWIVKYT